jgi:hypothetical protein
MFTRIGLTVLVLVFLTTGQVLAWPAEPPAKATISGPGLPGEVPITDKKILAALQLGVLEDFDQGIIPTPKVGQDPI